MCYFKDFSVVIILFFPQKPVTQMSGTLFVRLNKYMERIFKAAVLS